MASADLLFTVSTVPEAILRSVFSVFMLQFPIAQVQNCSSSFAPGNNLIKHFLPTAYVSGNCKQMNNAGISIDAAVAK